MPIKKAKAQGSWHWEGTERDSLKDSLQNSVGFCDSLDQILKKKKREKKNQRCIEEMLRSGFHAELHTQRGHYTFLY